MENTVYLRAYKEPPINKKEILRYAGVGQSTPQIDTIIDECIEELSDKLSYKVCYREFPINCNGETVDLTFTKATSSSLAKNLNECSSIVLFAATVGINMDRLIARYANISPTKSLLFQAIGAERIESLCNVFNREVTQEKMRLGLKTCPRFSPGYGDLSLDIQKDIITVLDCPRKIGVTLNESLLMSPSKSVTALIGVTYGTEQE